MRKEVGECDQKEDAAERKKRRKRVAKEVKAVAENVAEKRGWTKESD